MNSTRYLRVCRHRARAWECERRSRRLRNNSRTLQWRLRASVRDQSEAPRIYVRAGVNGAGKSSIGGAMFAQAGVEFFNPDVMARKFLASVPGITQDEANGAAWEQGRRLLDRAIEGWKDFAFETTLGGNTIPALVRKAISRGIEVRMWYGGLESAELHLAR